MRAHPPLCGLSYLGYYFIRDKRIHSCVVFFFLCFLKVKKSRKELVAAGRRRLKASSPDRQPFLWLWSTIYILSQCDPRGPDHPQTLMALAFRFGPPPNDRPSFQAGRSGPYPVSLYLWEFQGLVEKGRSPETRILRYFSKALKRWLCVKRSYFLRKTSTRLYNFECCLLEYWSKLQNNRVKWGAVLWE